MTKALRSARMMIDDMISATVALTGYPESHVRQFVEPAARYLLREYGGDRLPKVRRTYPLSEILCAIDEGVAKREVCRRYKISMWKLYRVLDVRNRH